MLEKKATLISPWVGLRDRIRQRVSGLQFRMALSYALTSLAAALLIEILFGAVIWSVLTFTTLPKTAYMSGARQAAELYALSAAAATTGGRLDPTLTFAPGHPHSIALSRDLLPNATTIPYVSTGTPRSVAIALLVAPNGRVLASSYPGQYPVGLSVAHAFPAQWDAIAHALTGTREEGTDTANQVFAVAPVVSHGQTIGAVYVQIPETMTVSTSFFSGFLGAWLVSAIFWLLLTLPIGGVFGLLTTRVLVRRVERLVDATSRFAAGDYQQRVTTGRADEVGLLEQHFNQMAEQVVEGMEQRQTLVAQQARREERARIEQDMRTARNIQQSLLPHDVPTLPGYQFLSYYQPAQEVGGDFYDFHDFEDGRLGIVVGDVSGEGIAAALVMAITRTMLRTAARATHVPGEVLARVNDLLTLDMPPGMFVTCFYAVLDLATGEISFANAGHDLPYLRRRDGVHELHATGMPLGLMPGMHYEQRTATVQSGDAILFYSDGIVEAHNPQREMFGFPRMSELVGQVLDDESLIDRLLTALASFTGPDWQQEDDLTLLELFCSASPSVASLL